MVSAFGFGDRSMFTGIIRDITEGKPAEESLRCTQFAVDQAAISVFWIRPDARFACVNEQACRSLGYSHEELLSMTVHDVDPGFPQHIWPDHWRELKKRASFSLESRHRAKDGRIFPVEITVNYVEFEGEEYNFAFARDITEHKQAEATLIGAETIQSVVDRTPGASFLETAAQIAGHYHEWYDGSGYPRGLKGQATPLAARIAALADVYDALTTRRVYKDPVEHDEAVMVVLGLSGRQFEPAVVEAFLARQREFATLAAELVDEPADPSCPGLHRQDEADERQPAISAGSSSSPVTGG